VLQWQTWLGTVVPNIRSRSIAQSSEFNSRPGIASLQLADALIRYRIAGEGPQTLVLATAPRVVTPEAAPKYECRKNDKPHNTCLLLALLGSAGDLEGQPLKIRERTPNEASDGPFMSSGRDRWSVPFFCKTISKIEQSVAAAPSRRCPNVGRLICQAPISPSHAKLASFTGLSRLPNSPPWQ
jgi:hypothetical protein